MEIGHRIYIFIFIAEQKMLRCKNMEIQSFLVIKMNIIRSISKIFKE